MDHKLTLHCFAGDPQSLAILLLAQFTEARLATRYLKPINLTEKLYKSSLTKTFPMLQLEQGDKSIFVERSMAILRHVARLNDNGRLYNEANAFEASLVDQTLDSVYQEVLPAVMTLNAHSLGFLELEEEQLAEVTADLAACLPGLDRSVARLPARVTLADFPLLALWLVLKRQPQAGKLVAPLKNFAQRIDLLLQDKAFAALARPHLLRVQ